MKEISISPPYPFTYLCIKRAMDYLLSGLFLLIFSPLMLLISVGIKLASAGPVVIRQHRIGKDGQPFDMLKFRSMHDHSSEQPHIEHARRVILENLGPQDLRLRSLKIQPDPRIFRFGRFIRRFGLDELPQFVNVLRGEMSLVGPRPPMAYEFELYPEAYNFSFR